MTRSRLGVLVAILLGTAGAASAQEASITMEQLSTAADTIWTLVAAFLVFFMQAGFACVECGFTRAKNAVNIMFKNLLDFSVGSLAFWAVGFGIMFGAGNALFGTSGFFLSGDADQTFGSLSWSSVPLPAKLMFQLVFAATAATIVSGAMAERTKFSSYLIYSVFITAVVYPVAGHWIWGGGWLAELGMWDFAGSTVVHSVGGWMALMGAIILGARAGKYDSQGRPRAIPGHNLPMAALGVLILWLGWFGFNPGSTMAADSGAIAHIALTTNLAAAAGVLGAVAVAWWRFGKADLSLALNGALAGLVAITAPCAFVSPVSAVIIGLIGGVAMIFAVGLLDNRGVDDPVGAVSVHGVCGALGTLCVGLFAQDQVSPGTTGNGLLFGGGWTLLGHQVIGVLAVFGWCVVAGGLLFGGIRATVGLRVSIEEELGGLDVGEHGSDAYSPDMLTPRLALVMAAVESSPEPAASDTGPTAKGEC